MISIELTTCSSTLTRKNHESSQERQGVCTPFFYQKAYLQQRRTGPAAQCHTANAQECLLIAAAPNDKTPPFLMGCDHKTDNTHREVASVPYGRCWNRQRAVRGGQTGNSDRATYQAAANRRGTPRRSQVWLDGFPICQSARVGRSSLPCAFV